IDELPLGIVEHQEINGSQSFTTLLPTRSAAGPAIGGAIGSIARGHDGMSGIERVHGDGIAIASLTKQPRTPATVRPMNAHAQVLGSAVRVKIICRTVSSDVDLPKQNCGKRSVSEEAGAASVEQRPTRTGVGCRSQAAVSSSIESSWRRPRDVTRWTEHERMLIRVKL